MTGKNHKKAILVLGDVLMWYVGLVTTLFVKYKGFLAWDIHVIPFLWVHALWIVIFFSASMYDWEKFPPSRRYYIVRLTLSTMLIAGVSAMALFYFIPSFRITPKTNLILDIAIVALLMVLWRTLFLKITSRASKINVLFLGTTDETKHLAKILREGRALGYHVVETLDHTRLDHHNVKNLISARAVHLVIVEPAVLHNQEMVQMFYDILPLGVTIEKFSEFYESVLGRVPTSIIGKPWFLENLAELQKQPFEKAKRAADIILSILLAIPTLILFPCIALAIKLDSSGPILYRQKRVGKNEVEFEFIKFRSMVKNADTLDGLKGDGNDARHTRVGRFLRSTYLDELPQIINVLKGEMSFVGPRPERPVYVTELKKYVPYYKMRLLVRPGITGWAQINMENDASVEDAPLKLQYDLYYIKNRSIVMDAAVMLKTAAAMLRRGGK